MSLKGEESIPRVKARTIKLKLGTMDRYIQILSCYTVICIVHL